MVTNLNRFETAKLGTWVNHCVDNEPVLAFLTRVQFGDLHLMFHTQVADPSLIHLEHWTKSLIHALRDGCYGFDSLQAFLIFELSGSVRCYVPFVKTPEEIRKLLNTTMYGFRHEISNQ